MWVDMKGEFMNRYLVTASVLALFPVAAANAGVNIGVNIGAPPPLSLPLRLPLR